jgi:hypothetical protein
MKRMSVETRFGETAGMRKGQLSSSADSRTIPFRSSIERIKYHSFAVAVDVVVRRYG